MRTLSFHLAGVVTLLTVGSTIGAASCSSSGSTTGSGGTSSSSTGGATTTGATTTATNGTTTSSTATGSTTTGTASSSTATGTTTSSTTGSTSSSSSASTGSAMSLCQMTGGMPMMGLCCATQSDYPNTCSIGTCTCAPSSSKMVEKCNCPAGKCYNPMTGCVAVAGG